MAIVIPSRMHCPTFLEFLMVGHLLLNIGGVDSQNKCRYHRYIEGLSDSITPEKATFNPNLVPEA